jgi:hypothetical protein
LLQACGNECAHHHHAISSGALTTAEIDCAMAYAEAEKAPAGFVMPRAVCGGARAVNFLIMQSA